MEAIALSNTPQLLRLFTFDDDDNPGPLSVDRVPLELGFGTEVGDTFEGFEMDGNAAALSTLFKDGVDKFFLSANHTAAKDGAGIGNDLTAVAAAARLELPPDGRKWGKGLA
jgi:hypothetical protein